MTTEISRRNVLALGLAGITVGLLAGCSSDDSSSTKDAFSGKSKGAMKSLGVNEQFKATTPLTVSLLFQDNPAYPEKSSWEIYYVPATQIIHYKGKSTESSASTVVDFYRAMYIFVKKHLRSRYLFFLHWFLVLGITMRAALSFAGQFLRRSFPVIVDAILLNTALLAAILLRFGKFIPLPPFWSFSSYLLIKTI